MTVDIRIHKDVLDLFPQLRVFSLEATGVRSSQQLIDLAARRLDEAAGGLRHAAPTAEALLGVPVIGQWREAYKAMGVKPSAYRCSVEALGRRAIADKPLGTGLPAVDLYNAASLRHIACLGAFDTGRLGAAPLELRFCRPAEDSFSPLGGKAEDMPLRPGVVVYAQGCEVLCWSLNHRDSEKTGLRPDTSDILFMAEGVTPDHAAHALQALASLRDDLRSLGIGTSEVQEAGGRYP